MSAYKHIKYDFTDGIARITLNRPPLNVLNIEMMNEIVGILKKLFDEDVLKLIVFSADGKSFSAGVDVGEHIGDQVRDMIQTFHDIFRWLVRINKPTLAVVQGTCLGGGCELATFCDVIVAAEDAKFGQPEIQVGVFPPIACLVWPEFISDKKALELLLTGNIIKAPEAEKIGLINKCVAIDRLDATADEYITRIKKLSAPVLGYTKKATLYRFNEKFSKDLDEIEHIYLNELMQTKDANEGLKAFLEKRPPRWSQR